MLDLDPAAREVTRLLGGVTDDHLSGRTPCEGTPVAGLLDHLMGLTLAFTWAAEKSTAEHGGSRAPGRSKATAETLDPAWRDVLPRQLEAVAAAWRDPAAWEGMTEAGGLTMPAEVTGLVALDELVLHGWDLARATGQGFTCDPASTEAVFAFTTQAAAPEQAANRDGLFGPVVEVPADAPLLDRALGLAGRDPAWRP
ncbi:MAG: hypothetical protein QOF82_636 [Frankiales bacterium]|jgi:uncharacterized protein (TIGR03086 family)|nr:hypothetical protein [Frankiales bacterium]